MSSQNSVEVTAETVEEAIQKGLTELGVGPSQVIVEVLEEPARGLFGLGAKQARVRLQRMVPSRPPRQEKPVPVQQPDPPVAQEPPVPAPAPDDDVQAVSEDPVHESEDDPGVLENSVQEIDHDDDFFDDDGSYGDEPVEVAAEKHENNPVNNHPDEAADAEIGATVLTEILEKMGVSDVRVQTSRANASEHGEGDEHPWMLNVQGGAVEELSGNRAELIASLQYLTRLIVSRRLERRANIVVDLDGYKNKRATALKKLAVRMADQAVETNRTVRMEPMPPNERRIIHMALRQRKDVETQSTGQGNNRRVTITPVRES